jgi:hypothetical protein
LERGAGSGFRAEDFLPATKNWRDQLAGLEHTEYIRERFETFEKAIRVIRARHKKNPEKFATQPEAMLSCWKFLGPPGTGKVRVVRV